MKSNGNTRIAPIPDRTALDAILSKIHIAGASVLNDRFRIIIHRGPANTVELTEKVSGTFSVTEGKIAEILDKDYCRPHQSQVGLVKQILDALGLKYKTPSIWDAKIHSFLDQLIKEEKSITDSPIWQARITRLHCKQDLRRAIAKLLTVDDSEAAKQLLDGLVNEELVRHIHNS